jgi:hypothetical protein
MGYSTLQVEHLCRRAKSSHRFSRFILGTLHKIYAHDSKPPTQQKIRFALDDSRQGSLMEAPLQLSSLGTMTISSNRQGLSLKFAGALKPKSGSITKRPLSRSAHATDLIYFGKTEQTDLKSRHTCYRYHNTGHAFGPACPEFASGQKGLASLAGRRPKGPLKATLFQK